MRKRAFFLVTLLLSTVTLHAAITGSVMTPDGAPVTGATVSTLAFEPSRETRLRYTSGSPAPAPLATTQTDAKGAFSLTSPKDPVFIVQVTADGFAPHVRRVVPDEEIGAIVLRKAPTKTGVVRSGGKPVAGATVVWLFALAEHVTKTDAEGRYTVPDPATATARVVLHPDFAPDLQTLGGTAKRTLDVNLVAGTAFKGRAVGPDRAPVPNAAVVVDGWPAGTTGEDGTFTVAHLHPTWQSIAIVGGGLAGIRYSEGKASSDIPLARAAAVTGTVTDAKTRLPVAGVAIQLMTATFNLWESQTLATDAKGRFSFSVPPGSYRWNPGHPMYVGRQEQVDVNAGQTSVRDQALSPLAIVAGNVVDEERKPVAAATISAEARESFSPGMPPPPSPMIGGANAISGPDGRFALRVRESEFRLAAAKKGLPKVHSETIKVAAGERKSGVNLVIPRGHAVTGRVTTADGRPIAGVRVIPSEAAGTPDATQRRIVIGLQPQQEDAIETASDGTFTIRLKEGSYDLAFRREGWSTTTSRGVAVSARTPPVEVTMGPSIDISGRVVRNGIGVEGVAIFTFSGMEAGQTMTGADGSFVLTDLREGPVRLEVTKLDSFIRETHAATAPSSNVLIELPPGGRITGRVIDKSTRAPVTSFSAGVAVSRGGVGAMMFGSPQRRSFSSDDGSFALDGIAPGLVKVTVSAPGYVSSASGGVTLEDGKTIENLEIELDRGVRLAGRVTAPDGSPVAGAMVRELQPRSSGPLMTMSPTATTDGNGEYAIEAVEAGEKTFQFSHNDYVTVQKEAKLSGREVRLDAQLANGLSISGMVVTEAGAPVADARVVASGQGGMEQATTDSGGLFRMEQLKPGRYTFMANKTGMPQGTTRDVDVSSGQQVRITIPAGGSIYGRVSGLQPKELAQVTVFANSTASAPSMPMPGFFGSSSNSSAVDRNGNYRIEGVAAGTVRVSAFVSGGASQRSSRAIEVQIAAGESRQVDVEFVSGATVTGRVTRGGQPLPSANISFRPKKGGQAHATVMTNGDGIYTASGLEEGEYSVSVIDQHRLSPYNTTYTVSGSATFNIDMKSTSVYGRVVDASNGGPVREPRILLRPEGQIEGAVPRTVFADMNGIFTVDFVVPGRYTVSAERDGYGARSVELTVSEGAPNDVEIRMTKTDGVQIKLVDARDGKPVQGSVSVRDAQGRPVAGSGPRWGTTPGDIQLFLEPGTYTATVFANGYSTQTVTITSPGSQTIHMRPGGTLEVRSSTSASGSLRARLIGGTDPAPAGGPLTPGSTKIPNLSAGVYTLEILDEKNTVLKTLTVTIVEGQTTTVDV